MCTECSVKANKRYREIIICIVVILTIMALIGVAIAIWLAHNNDDN